MAIIEACNDRLKLSGMTPEGVSFGVSSGSL
jgi:hypothetical protein